MKSPLLIKSILTVEFVIVALMIFFGFIYERPEPIVLPEQECGFAAFRGPEIETESLSPPQRNPFAYPKAKVEVRPAEVVVKAEVQQVGNSLIYKGLIEMNGEKTAILFNGDTKKTVFARDGDDVFGYKVVDIAENSIVLSEGKSMSLITLKVGGVGGKE